VEEGTTEEEGNGLGMMGDHSMVRSEGQVTTPFILRWRQMRRWKRSKLSDGLLGRGPRWDAIPSGESASGLGRAFPSQPLTTIKGDETAE